MIYALLIWTVVAAGSGGREYHDWKMLAEFHQAAHSETGLAAQKKCEDAAQQLGLNSKLYRCIRIK